MSGLPATMPAAVYRGARTVEVAEVPVPVPGPGEVLIEVSHCGICGSDLHMVMEDWGQPGSVSGHEYSGTVVAVGPGVDGCRAGDRVLGGPSRGCGACRFCDRDQPNLCEKRPRAGIDPFSGAFARYKLVASGALYRVPDGLDLRTAALAEPLAVALRGVRRAGGDLRRVLVTGAGPIGALTVAVLAERGAGWIAVSEPSPARRELAARLGASVSLDPAELRAPDLPMDVVSEPYSAAIDCSGRPDAIEAALAQLDRGATLVLSGTGMRRPRLDTNRMILNELSITGTVEYSPTDFEDAIEMLAAGKVAAAAVIEPADVPLGRVQWAMEELVAGRLAGKVMVVPRA